MYLGFYGLREKPFTPTPNPKFLFHTPAHREALAQLLYGVQERKGFILLTGEVGTGKTTLLQALRQKLEPHTAVAFVFNSALTFESLLEYVLEDLGIAKAGESTAQRLVTLNGFLIERQRAGQNTVLILDEAHNLSPAALEQVRLLSNFETQTEKLLQILLVGQPELRARLALPELRQLRQRIGLRCTIPPLTVEQTHDYVRARLRIAGAQDLALFTDRALARIAAYSGGVPRIVNTVCDHCLLVGYADRKRRIDADIVAEAIEYLEDDAPPPAPRAGLRGWLRPARWLAGGLAAAMAVVAVVETGLAGTVTAGVLDLARLVTEVVAR